MSSIRHTALTTELAELSAGVAKIEITNKEAGLVNDALYVKAMVLKNDMTTAVLITLDAVAIGEIGHNKNDYLPKCVPDCSGNLIYGRRMCLSVPVIVTE